MESFLTHAGYIALILFAFIEACSIPISSEITFGFAGVLASQGHLNLVLVIILGTAAEMAGSYVSYLVGRRGGRRAVERLGRYVLVTPTDIDRAERVFRKGGGWAVLVGRLLPLIRAFTSIVAGISEVPSLRFNVLNLIATTIWATALSSIGYALGSAYSKVEKDLSLGSYVLVIIVVVPLAALILHRLRSVRKETAAGRHAAQPKDHDTV
ncbi:MAG TPA: DedA family protein [Streptosporangiaceae bacterium]